jgi:hypothetical protein
MRWVGVSLAVVLGAVLVSLAAADDYRDAARRAGIPLKDDALYYNPHIANEKGRTSTAGAALVSSSFAANDEGWTAWKPSGWKGAVTFTSGMVSVSSTGNDNVYFSSPESWRGDRSAAYNGKLTFRTGTTSSSGDKVTDGTVFDVALVAQCGYALTLSGLLSNTQTQDYSIDLHEDANWIDSRTGKKPNMFDFLGVLSNLEAVRIRGSLNTGDETSALYQASLLAGRQWHPCCTLDDTVDICTKPGAPYYNPETLKFYCEGHLAQPVRVKTVFPRFARRTGGATITVRGENFGLEGSTPIVRVGGLMCQRTWYPGPDSPTSGNKGPIQEEVLYCQTPENEGFDRGVTVEAASGSVDSPYQVRQSADRTVWEVREASATSCLSDDTHGFEFGGHDFQWAAAVKNKATVGTHPVAVDRNTGDVYMVVSATDTSALDTEVAGAHIRSSDNNPYQCAANAKCELLYKFSRDGSPLWVALMVSAAQSTEDLDVTSLVVDESDSPPSVYVAGTYKPQAADLTNLKVYPGSGKGNTVPSFSGPTTVSNIAAQSLAATGTAGAIGFVARYDADGLVHWARPIICDSDTTGVAGVRMTAYRPSTSRIINYHTQGDEPSQAYILGKQKDNGGVYVTGLGSLASAKTMYFGYEPTQYQGNANPSAVQSAAAAGTVFVPFLLKMDKDGAVIWSRSVGRDDTTNVGVSGATKVVISDVAAGDDKVFVSVIVNTNKLLIDSCQFQSKIEGQGSTLSENAVCTINSANTATLEGSNFDGAYIIAYDASGVYQWSQKQTASGSSITSVSLGWARSFRGGRPLKGNVKHWASHETLLGRLQPSMGRMNDIGSENRDESISDGTWLYSATTFGLAGAAATITVTGAAFPEVSPATVTLATSGANNKLVLIAKYKAATGATQWAEPLTYVNADGSNDFAVSVSDIAVDDQTGAVYVAGQAKTISASGQNAATLHCNTDNKDAASECGRDMFGIHSAGDLNRVGCPADPRREIRSMLCSNGNNRAACTKGLYNKQVGLPFCRFVTLGAKNTAFVAKINEGYSDSYRRTKSQAFSPDGTLVEWFKYLGTPIADRFGTTLQETTITLETLSGRIAIHDSDVYVTGQGLGINPANTDVTDGTTAKSLYPLTLRFEGVHSVNSTDLAGISFGSSAVSAGFLAKLVD